MYDKVSYYRLVLPWQQSVDIYTLMTHSWFSFNFNLHWKIYKISRRLLGSVT